jgi:hypothetical protein
VSQQPRSDIWWLPIQSVFHASDGRRLALAVEAVEERDKVQEQQRRQHSTDDYNCQGLLSLRSDLGCQGGGEHSENGCLHSHRQRTDAMVETISN